MRPVEEVQKEVDALVAIRPRLVAERPRGVFGSDYVSWLDAEVELLKRYIKNPTAMPGYVRGAMQAAEWLTGGDDLPPSEGWSDLLGPEKGGPQAAYDTLGS